MMPALGRPAPVAVMQLDATGPIAYGNPDVAAIYRMPSAEMPGQTLAEIYATARATRNEDMDADSTVELRMQNPDRIVHVRRVEIPGLEGEPSGVLTLHEDVTAQRLALEAKDLMLRAIGHEVRSPAAAMKTTLAGILQWDSTIDAKGRRALLQEAYESSDRLLSLVESQLIIAKLETRHFEPNPEAVELRSTLDGVMNVLTHRYTDRVLAAESELWVRVGGGMESVPARRRHGPADAAFPPPGGPWEPLALGGRLVGWAEKAGLATARRSAELGQQLAGEERDHLVARLGHKLRSA